MIGRRTTPEQHQHQQEQQQQKESAGQLSLSQVQYEPFLDPLALLRVMILDKLF